MKQIAALFSLGLLSGTLCVYAQQPAVPAPDLTKPATPASNGPMIAPGLPAETQKPAGDAPGTADAAQNDQPAPPVPAPDVSPSYTLGVSDVIAVVVWREPSLSGPLVIRPDGKVTLPLLGDIPAAGLTPMQLAEDIRGRLRKFINEPAVTVTVTAVNSQRIYFSGEVMHQGPMNLAPGMTMLQAFAAAGGLSPYANQKKIYILRGPAGHQKRIPYDYKKALKQGNDQGVVLQPGDTIVVPG